MKRSELRKMLITEINGMGESDFHHVCIEYLSHKHKQRFINSGINKRGRPLGHDLDGISPDSSISGEFSVDQDYFTGKFSKLRGDLEHSLSRNPRPKTIILISSQSVGNIARKTLQVYLKVMSVSKGRNISFVDANQLVDEMIDMSAKSHAFYEACAPYMSIFRQLMVLFGSENQFPNLTEDYCSRPLEEKTVRELIQNNQIVLLHGVSGIGKSQIAIKTKDSMKRGFDFVVWINGNDLNDLTSLSSYTMRRYGNSYDIRALLAESDVFLYIDSLEGKDHLIQDLHQVKMSKGSRIVITSQKNVTATRVATRLIKGMSIEQFSSVLSNGLTLPSDLVKMAYVKSDGHPLLATTLNKMLLVGDIDHQQLRELLENVGAIETNRNETILKSLIKNHLNLIRDGLIFVKTFATSRMHKRMMELLLGQAEILKLKSRGFLNQIDDDYYRVHDLIFNALMGSGEIPTSSVYENGLIDLFEKKDQLSELEFFQISNNHLDLLKNIAWTKGSTTAFYLTASYIIVDDKFDGGEFLAQYMPKVQSIDPQKASHYEAMLVVEFHEVMYRFYRYYKNDEALALSMARGGLDFCKNVLKLQTQTSFEASMLHHAGKFSRQLQSQGEAIEYFEKALEKDVHFHAASLQLFKGYHWIDTDKKSTDELKAKYGGKAKTSLITDILENGVSNYEDVSPSVLLHSFQELRKSPFYDAVDSLIPKFDQLFYKTLGSAQFTNRHDFLDVVGGIGERFMRHNLSEFLSHFAKMKIPAPSSAPEKSCFSLGQIYKYVAREKRDVAALEVAELYYRRLLVSDKIRDYELTHIIDCYNISAKYHAASELHQKLKVKDEAFACLRNAWTLHGLGKRQEALEQINLGITKLPKHFIPQHMSSFQSLKNLIERDEPLDDVRAWRSVS